MALILEYNHISAYSRDRPVSDAMVAVDVLEGEGNAGPIQSATKAGNDRPIRLCQKSHEYRDISSDVWNRAYP